MRHLPENFYAIQAGNFKAINTPEIKEVRGKDWVYYGEDNLFPQLLIDLYDKSAIHHTAIEAISDGIYGEGINLIGDEYVNLKGETVNEVFEKISLDYTLYQGFALNVVWNKEGSAIAEIYHLPFSDVRSGKMNDDGEVSEYFYSVDWKNTRKYTPVPYRAFDVTNTKGDNASQIYYCYNYTPGNYSYPLPAYVGALADIQIDIDTAVFHASNLSSGLSPSMFIQFRNGVPSPEEQRDIYRQIEDTFSGAENAGRFFLAFSEPGKEMQVEPITATNDSYYLTLEERITSRILTAHRITSPLLLGIKDAAGFSNNADEIVIAYSHWEGTVIEPKRKKVVDNYAYALRLMGYNIKVEVIPSKLLNINQVQDGNSTPGI